MTEPERHSPPMKPAEGSANYRDRPTEDGKFGEGEQEPTSSRPRPPDPKPTKGPPIRPADRPSG